MSHQQIFWIKKNSHVHCLFFPMKISTKKMDEVGGKKNTLHKF